jgi:hypothetical protein
MSWENEPRALSEDELREQVRLLRLYGDPIQTLAARRWRIVLDELLRRSTYEGVTL